MTNASKSYKEIISEIWKKCGVIMCIYILEDASLVMLFSYIPFIMTDYFAQQYDPGLTSCQDYHPKPKACESANRVVVTIGAIYLFVKMCLLSTFSYPIVGGLSDQYGRKPFIILANVLYLPSLLVPILLDVVGFPAWWYYPLSLLAGIFSSLTSIMASFADVLTPEARTTAFTLLQGVACLGFLLGSLIAALLGPERRQLTTLLSVGFNVSATLLYLIFVRETLPAENRVARASAKSTCSKVTGYLSGLPKGIKIMVRNNLFIKLALLQMIQSFVSFGVIDLFPQWAQLTLNFKPVDFQIMFFTSSILRLFVLVVLSRQIQVWLGDKGMIVMGTAASVVSTAMSAVAGTIGLRSPFCGKMTLYSGFLVGVLSSLNLPAISAIKSANVSPNEQGLVQGALYGGVQLASGLGPALFAWLFRIFSHSDGGQFGLYIPSLPIYIGAAVSFCAVLIVLSIDMEKDLRPRDSVAAAGDIEHATNKSDEQVSSTTRRGAMRRNLSIGSASEPLLGHSGSD